MKWRRRDTETPTRDGFIFISDGFGHFGLMGALELNEEYGSDDIILAHCPHPDDCTMDNFLITYWMYIDDLPLPRADSTPN